MILVGFELVLKWQFRSCGSAGMKIEGVASCFLIG